MLNQAVNTATSSPFITPLPPTGEEQRVASVLNKIEEHLGFVPDGLKLYSLSPPLLETFVGNIGYFAMGGTSLAPELTTFIRYLVSSKAECHFCIDLNEGFLDNMGIDIDRARESRKDIEKTPINHKERALLKLAVRSVDASTGDITQADIDQMKDLGWTDREVFDAIVQAANIRSFNHILRAFNIEHQGTFA